MLYCIIISATINMKGGRGKKEKFSARKRAVNYKASRKPPTTNPRIAHDDSRRRPGLLGLLPSLIAQAVNNQWTGLLDWNTLVDTSFNLTGSISYLVSEFFNLKLGASRCLVLSINTKHLERVQL